MKHARRVIFVLGLLLALSTSAFALTAGTIPDGGGTNEFSVLFGGNEIGGYYGGQLYLTGTANLILEYYGAEAGYHNEFNFNGAEAFDHAGGNTVPSSLTPLQTVAYSNVSAGLLNFSFDYNNKTGSVINGSNPDNTIFNQPNYFLTFDPYKITAGGSTSGTSVWLFLDDGATTDDNHDDMLVKISVTGGSINMVPEPATMLLLGLGLVGLAGLRRKVQK